MIPIEPRRDHHPRTPFALHVIRGNALAQVVAIGEVRQEQAHLLRRCVVALAERGAILVAVDMRDVTFVSPAALRDLSTMAAAVPATEVFLVGVGGTAREKLARRHAHTRIRVPYVRCRNCTVPERFTLPRRW